MKPSNQGTLTKLACIASLFLLSACDSGSLNRADPRNPQSDESNLAFQDGESANALFESRELTVSWRDTTIYSKAQCFCLALYKNTQQFYYFVDQKAILILDFDNKSIDFEPTGVMYLFNETATNEKIEQWMNNQHSDGLYINPAEPIYSFPISADDITITSRAYVETEKGYYKDVYETYAIDFTVNNISEERFFYLNSFSDTSTVYLESAPPQFE